MKHKRMDEEHFICYTLDLEQYSSMYNFENKVKWIQQLQSSCLETTVSDLQFHLFISKTSLQPNDILLQIGRILNLDEKDGYFFTLGMQTEMISTWNEITMLLFWKRQFEHTHPLVIPLIESYYSTLRKKESSSSPFSIQTYPDLMDYCKNQLKMNIDSRVCIAKHESMGHCLLATESIPSNTTILSIPMDSILCRTTICKTYPQFLQIEEEEDGIFLQLFLLSSLPTHEHTYIKYLPQECDANSPLMISPSELHHYIHPCLPLYHEVLEIHSQWEQFQKEIVTKYPQLQLKQDLSSILWSKWIVDSRTFLQANQLCLVPFVDYLNSEEIPNMEYKGVINQETKCFEFKTMVSIDKSEQLCIRYGNYGNRESWLFYGYLLSHFKNDVLHLEVETEDSVKEVYIKAHSTLSSEYSQIGTQLIEMMKEEEHEYWNNYTPMQIELIQSCLDQ